ncbi:hypothetical protein PPL_03412 [Heterostelium album PN500]|uniref:Uncharacterized protein n=1 Tax=Heterostelium pallidum (strain ATCC 26659 / Pp 5 / PN500) TaxID=670386 RepID=D3B4T6_HETP5|nr:hypothetical protein PPL_03412 [Heterostelium album PN500]EFA84334.1 hypothetical protein PPL_03412 [Heterostelium album PN500]|eukprot:XP_020436449.1 hypothetical protein PPL_03412 [Heterostelium album PN500]
MDEISNINEERDRVQKKLIDDNPSNQFHRGHVEYKLPVLIITKILEYSWRISTSNHINTALAYEEALQLTLINKQFFGIVRKMFNNVALLVKSSRMAVLHNRLNSVWCPIKHIVKLHVGAPILEKLTNQQQSVHLTHMLSTVEKLYIHYETHVGSLTVTSLKNFGTIATRLRSITLFSVTIEPAHLDAICLMKSLRNINISIPFLPTADFLTTLCNNLPLLESIKLINFDVASIPKSCRSTIRKLSV